MRWPTECEEVAANIMRHDYRITTMAEATFMAKRFMGFDESSTIIDNVAEAMLEIAASNRRTLALWFWLA